MNDCIIFHGVRGSIPTPGATTAAVGGNTSCVEVRLNGETILLDGGTGLRQVGLARRQQTSRPIYLLLSHFHWDHIQGIPFFAPLYRSQGPIQIFGPVGAEVALRGQMANPTFPVNLESVAVSPIIGEIAPGTSWDIGEVQIFTAPLRHPGGGLGYRLEGNGHAVVYLTDTEHPAQGVDPIFFHLAQDADVLIYDAQYLPEEYPQKIGWGHSTYEKGIALAQAAGVKQLFLFHHDPGRDDVSIARLERQARSLFPAARVACEGMTVALGQITAHYPSSKNIYSPKEWSIPIQLSE